MIIKPDLRTVNQKLRLLREAGWFDIASVLWWAPGENNTDHDGMSFEDAWRVYRISELAGLLRRPRTSPPT